MQSLKKKYSKTEFFFYLYSYSQIAKIMTSVQESNSTANGAAVDKEKAVSSESPAPDPSNPYFFPAFAIPLDFQFNGVPVMKYPVTDDPLTHIKKVHALPMKEDDIIITAYPKCGEFRQTSLGNHKENTFIQKAYFLTTMLLVC